MAVYGWDLDTTAPPPIAPNDVTRQPSLFMSLILTGCLLQMEDLKAQLEESECCRLELEAQLNTAGYYQQQVCHNLCFSFLFFPFYIYQQSLFDKITLLFFFLLSLLKQDPPLSSEADFCPNEKPLNSHTKTLKDAYKETRELLRQQNIIRESIQEQLSCDPPSLAPHTPSIWLHDTEGNLQELRDLLPETEATPLLSPASDSQDFFSQSDGDTEHQNQLNGDDCQQVPSSKTQINNSEYSSLTLEEQHVPPDQAAVRKLSREVELLTGQNEALNQRNQEMLNQLTEADREIERLKAELSSRYAEPHHFPEEEQLGHTGVEDLERELNLRNQELLEAQTLITSLEENLRETEALLQLNAPAEAEGTGRETSERAEKAEGYLLRCLEATEAKLLELERRLGGSEVTCGELQTQNVELKEDEKRYRQAATEAEADIRRLNEELEEERLKGGEDRRVSGEERIQQVIEEAVVRLNALGKLLEVIDKSDVGLRKESEENKPTVLSQLKWEEEFWSSLHSKLKSSQLHEEKHVEELLSEVTERMMVEKQMLLLGLGLLSETDEGRETKKTDESRMFDVNNQLFEIKHKISLLNRLSSSGQDKLQPMADRLSDFSKHPWSGFIHSAATEALYCCHLIRLQSKHERELEELTSSLICSNCVDLTEENRKLRAKLSNLEEQQSQSLGDKMSVCCQTEEIHLQDTDSEFQVADQSPEGVQTPETAEEETVESQELDCMEIPLPCVGGQLGIQEIDAENAEKSDASLEETDASFETEQVLVLRRRVKELEEQLTVREEELKEEFHWKMSSVQTQHEKKMEKLKVCGAVT